MSFGSFAVAVKVERKKDCKEKEKDEDLYRVIWAPLADQPILKVRSSSSTANRDENACLGNIRHSLESKPMSHRRPRLFVVRVNPALIPVAHGFDVVAEKRRCVQDLERRGGRGDTHTRLNDSEDHQKAEYITTPSFYGYSPAAEKEADGVWRSLVER